MQIICMEFFDFALSAKSKKERYDVPHGINYPYIDPTVIIPENVVNNGVRYSVREMYSICDKM